MVYALFEPAAPSFFPVTVTVLGTSHPVPPPLDVENVSEAGDATRLPGSLLARLTTTVDAGACVSITAKVAVRPDRVVTRPLCGDM